VFVAAAAADFTSSRGDYVGRSFLLGSEVVYRLLSGR